MTFYLDYFGREEEARSMPEIMRGKNKNILTIEEANKFPLDEII